MNNTTTKILSSLTLALLSALPMTGHAAPGNSPGFVQVTGSYSTIGNLITPFVGSISCSYRASVPDSSTLGTKKINFITVAGSASGLATVFSAPLSQSDYAWITSQTNLATLIPGSGSSGTSPAEEYPATLVLDLSSTTPPAQGRLRIESSLGWYTIQPALVYLESNCDIPNAVVLNTTTSSTSTTTSTTSTTSTSKPPATSTTTVTSTTTTTTIRPTTTSSTSTSSTTSTTKVTTSTVTTSSTTTTTMLGR